MARNQRLRRSGLTLFQALLLLLLALLAAGVAVVAIQAANERARRLQCVENLRKIGQSILQFHEAKRTLPASRIADGYATWVAQIGPYLPLAEQNNPLKGWDQEKPYDAQPPAVREAQIPFYYCPERRAPPQLSVEAPGKKRPQGALGDYAGVAGDDNPPGTWDKAEANGALVLGEVLERQGDRIVRWRSRTNLESLARDEPKEEKKRGTSHTLLVGEKHVPQGAFGQAEQGDGPFYDGALPASSMRIAGPGHGLAQSPADPFRLQFGSYHPGVCNFLYADGRVETMANAVNEDVLGRLANRRE
jgi:prepilin-type processing-associated H-X9-DG protein